MKLHRPVFETLRRAVFVGVSASAWPAPVTAAQLGSPPSRPAFDTYEVVLGSRERQTVLTGFLLGNPMAEIVVLHVADDGQRRLRVHAFERGAWVPRFDATLGRRVRFVDVARIDGRDRLLAYEPGRLTWFEPETRVQRELAALTCSFDPPRADEVPVVDVARDVNGDGRDDLVVPQVDGFAVLVQREGGAFADPVQVGTRTNLSRILGADGYRYDPWSRSRVHEVDYDQDGRVDLVFWNEDHFEVHTQDERGRFASQGQAFTTDVRFDSDDLDWLSSGDMVGRVLHTLADLNADGVADLVVFTLSGKRLSKKRSSFEVHFGVRDTGRGTVFAREAGRTFRSGDRLQVALSRHDFDQDGRVDLMITSIERNFLEGSLWKRLKGFMGDDVIVDLEFYRMRAGRYPGQPNATSRMALDGPPSHRERGWIPLDVVLRGATHERRRTQELYPRAFNMILLVGDVSGDGLADLMIENTHRGLPVRMGLPGATVFAERSWEVEVGVPNDEEYVQLVDLDGDGTRDVLMHHPFTDKDAHGGRLRPPGTEPHRVTALIARRAR